jgi:AraC family transcriptional regulator of adaptative response/methylated-DNA-[protein]-cysteine methyltransferase
VLPLRKRSQTGFVSREGGPSLGRVLRRLVRNGIVAVLEHHHVDVVSRPWPRPSTAAVARTLARPCNAAPHLTLPARIGVWRDQAKKTILGMTMTATSNTGSKVAVPSLFPGKAWQQVLERDARADGQFVYAVKSTKIFCRPSCPSRRPTRKNVTFFPSPAAAEAAGYRACLRCEPQRVAPRADPQADAIALVAGYLQQHQGERTRLKYIAKATGVGKFTILRGFKRVLGVSPGEYGRAQKIAAFKARVREPKAKVTDAIYDAGFGSSSRLYEGADAALGMTPTALKNGGKDLRIRYTLADSPLGALLVAATDRGICSIAFGDSDEALVEELRATFPRAELKQMDRELSYAIDAVVGGLKENAGALVLPLDVRATAFQQRVWRELQSIPRGETRTYSQVAAAIGSPRSVRAVAAACAANPVALAVPCHRVVGKDGTLTGYRWGLERKRQLLQDERVD